MSCEEVRALLAARLADELTIEERRELEQHVAECAACAAEAAEMEDLWRDLEDLPREDPGPRVRADFERMLAREAAKASGRSSWHGLLPIAASLLAGVALGYLGRGEKRDDIASLERQVSDLREVVAVTLLEHGSVSERLQGVAYGRGAAEDDRIVGALFTRLLEDPNVNVRLAAVDALRPMMARGERRGQLLEAVAHQDSPLVAISLIDLLLEAGGAGARKGLMELSGDSRLDPAIRGYLRDRLGRSV
jgi:anti-sigma factor RsiW